MANVMAAATGASLGTLFVRLTADAMGLIKGMADAQSAVSLGAFGIGGAATKAAATVTGAFVVMGAVVTREAAKFEHAMVQSTSIMGNISATLRAELEATARTIALESVNSATDLAEALFYLSSAGYSAQQSIKLLPVVDSFAQAGAFNLDKATTLLADSLTALGLRTSNFTENAKEMVRVSDVLTKANILANGSVQGFAEALTNKAANALRLVNKSVEEGVAVLAAFAERGIKSRHAGEQLHMVLRDLQRTAIDNAHAYSLFNVQVFDSNGNMNNMADIIGDVERALSGMTDKQKRQTLELMGFQDRSLAATLALVGSSDAIRKYEAELKKAGGTTKEVADNRLTSFINQLVLTWHQIQDLFITVGMNLIPSLRELAVQIQDGVKWLKEYENQTGVLTGTLMTVIGVFKAMALAGVVVWTTLRSISTMIATSLTIELEVLEIAITTVISLFKRWQDAGFAIIKGMVEVARSIAGVSDVMDALIKRDLKGAKDAFISMAKEAGGALGGLTKEMAIAVVGSVVDVQEGVKNTVAVTKGLVKSEADEVVAQWATVADLSRKWFSSIEEPAKASVNKVADVTKSAADAAIKQSQKVVDTHYANVLEIELASKRATETMDKMDIPKLGKFESPFKGLIDPNIEKTVENSMEIKDAEKKLAALREIGKNEVGLTEEVQKRKLDAINYYTKRSQQLQMAQNQMALQSASSIFDSLGSMAKSFAGEQSTVYKAMFAASKAFAIADSIVKIQQGIAAAASLPWPANLAAMASVAAATANIVSSIQAIRLEFGGGKASGGPVSSGKAFLVGEKGPEIFVPSERGNIVPNDQLSNIGKGQPVRVIVNNHTDGRAEVTEHQDGDERVVDVVIRRVKNQIGAEIRERRGDITRALEGTYSLRRGKK